MGIIQCVTFTDLKHTTSAGLKIFTDFFTAATVKTQVG
jgi:hypothetical protein